MKKVTLMVPCYNEECGVAEVIRDTPVKDFRRRGYDVEILVIDNNSTDRTSEVARRLGARVVFEGRQGKGHAIRRGFDSVGKDVDFVVMVDGDNTYKPYELLRLVELLDSGFSDVVIGSRLEGNMLGEAMSFSHRAANWFFTFLTRRFYGANVSDTCTGYFAWRREVVEELRGHVRSSGFAIEAEMISKMARLGFRVHAVPITYEKRSGDSKLAPFRDGVRITWMLLRNVGWRGR